MGFLRCAVLIVCAAVAGHSQTPPGIAFPATGKVAAHAEFIKGIAALHNAGYDDAVELFRSAEKIDPDFVMAYWGEAMTFNHPFWAEQDAAGGRATSPGLEVRLPQTIHDIVERMAALAAGASAKDVPFYEGKIASARWFAQNRLPLLTAEKNVCEHTADDVMKLPIEAF